MNYADYNPNAFLTIAKPLKLLVPIHASRQQEHPIRMRRLPGGADTSRHHPVDEPQGQPTGQRTDGKLLPHAQDRVGAPSDLTNPQRGQTRPVRLCRGLIQPAAVAFSHRLPHPCPGRKASDRRSVNRPRRPGKITERRRAHLARPQAAPPRPSHVQGRRPSHLRHPRRVQATQQGTSNAASGRQAKQSCLGFQ